MRWTHFLATDADARTNFETYIAEKIKSCHEAMERHDCLVSRQQGSVSTLRQILLDLETENKEFKADGYRQPTGHADT